MADRLIVAPREALGIATVMTRKGVDPREIGARLGADMPSGPRATFTIDTTIIGTGPGAWLVIREAAAPDFAEALGEALSDLASVSDQTGGYLVLHVSGSGARTLLRRGTAIDLHPDTFGVGSAATTVIAHIGVILWQVDDQPSYDIAIFRSYEASFRHWLREAAAQL